MRISIRNRILTWGSTVPVLLFTGVFASNLNSTAKTSLTIEASDFETDSGQAVIFLFRESDKIPKEPFRKVFGKITGHRTSLEIPEVNNGAYAAILLHDLNKNGLIDHPYVIPGEPLGFSNDWKLGLFSGMVTFHKLNFLVSDTNRTLSIPIVFRKK